MASYVVLLPLLGALIAGLGCRVLPARLAELITSFALLASAVIAGITFNEVIFLKQPYQHIIAPWFESGLFKVEWSVTVDALTAVMLVVITWVSTVVHFYSIGYMHEDTSRQRFMAYLSLFTFFMLMLVTSNNFVQLFLGWEGVGLASYLLIGFWFKKPEANAAAMKAFLVNRVGDLGLALGIFTIFQIFGTLTFAEIFPVVGAHAADTFYFLGYEIHALTLVALLLFIGCMGKSAQLGLHTWLPDAMEGPTPVSALIHAATMVTAGVFLVARCSPIFELSPLALSVVTVVGACTAIFAATIGLVQNDIKRVIAYSTCSQLGYMFFACGVSAYSAGVFHLMTHAFFKALLFLGAGSVIHGMHHEQDMRNMGGLWKKLPVTYAFMWIGSLALAGIGFGGFGFAGYFSKDLILESAYASHAQYGHLAYYLGVAGAFLTAFYSGRLMFMTFHGKTRADKHTFDHAHESPAIMLVPLVLLVAGAIGAGAIGVQMGIVDPSYEFWNGALFVLSEQNSIEHAHHVEHWVKYLPLGMAVGGLVLSWVFYMLAPGLPGFFTRTFKLIHTFFFRKWFFDELYDRLFVRTSIALGNHLWKFWDTVIVDGLGPNGMAWVQKRMGVRTSQSQTGYLYHYAFVMLVGLVLLGGLIVFTRLATQGGVQ